jgi:DNA-binding MarR family transcriptional regulator
MQLNIDDALGFNIDRVATLFRRELVRALSDYKMTPEQWQVMAKLWGGESLSQMDIAQLTLMDNFSVSRIFTRLEKNGWVKRMDNSKDGRSNLIQPTDKGWRLKEEVPEKLITHFQPIIKSLGKKEGEELLKSLKKLRLILEDR